MFSYTSASPNNGGGAQAPSSSLSVMLGSHSASNADFALVSVHMISLPFGVSAPTFGKY